MRPSWDEYFLSIATAVSARGTCNRKRVGCVLVRDRVILATGYNGSVRGAPHCDDVGHDLHDSHCLRASHAEANAIAQAAATGIRVAGALAYVTCTPCWPCYRLLCNAGIVGIVIGGEYRLDPRVRDACAAAMDGSWGVPIETVQPHIRNDEDALMDAVAKMDCSTREIPAMLGLEDEL